MDATYYWAVIVCGALALVYGAWATSSVLAASAGNPRMQEIAAAVQEGARAYLNRQYRTIGLVGVVLLGSLVPTILIVAAVLWGTPRRA